MEKPTDSDHQAYKNRPVQKKGRERKTPKRSLVYPLLTHGALKCVDGDRQIEKQGPDEPGGVLSEKNGQTDVREYV